MNIEEILDLMDKLLDDAGTFPFSNKKSIDAEQMREYIDSVRYNLPGEIKRAKDTEREKKAIIAESKKKGEEVIKKAEERAKILVSQQEIIKEATEIANEQIKRAKEQAEEIINDSLNKDKQIRQMLSDNINKVLSDAEVTLAKTLEDVTATKNAVLSVASPKNS